jgi:hypothetical protein
LQKAGIILKWNNNYPRFCKANKCSNFLILAMGGGGKYEVNVKKRLRIKPEGKLAGKKVELCSLVHEDPGKLFDNRFEFSITIL